VEGGLPEGEAGRRLPGFGRWRSGWLRQLNQTSVEFGKTAGDPRRFSLP